MRQRQGAVEATHSRERGVGPRHDVRLGYRSRQDREGRAAVGELVKPELAERGVRELKVLADACFEGAWCVLRREHAADEGLAGRRRHMKPDARVRVGVRRAKEPRRRRRLDRPLVAARERDVSPRARGVAQPVAIAKTAPPAALRDGPRRADALHGDPSLGALSFDVRHERIGALDHAHLFARPVGERRGDLELARARARDDLVLKDRAG